MTTSAVPDAQWQLLGERVAGWTGLAFDKGRTRELRHAMEAACAELGQPAVEPFVRRLLASTPGPDWLEVLAQHLTVGETYFFRDPKSLDALAQDVLPGLIRLRRGGSRRLRLWSAGCCTGEEPYSLAILLHRLQVAQPPWDARILATDINAQFLRKARSGVYGDWSFRGDPCKLRDAWFQPAPGGRYAVLPGLRRMVDFAEGNLATGTGRHAHESGMDLILCRNVLMYLSPAAMASAVARFHAALAPGGWLAVSPSEASDSLYPGFEPVSVQGIRFYRKAGPATAPAPEKPAVPRRVLAKPAAVRPLPQAPAPQPQASPSPAAAARALADQGRLAEAGACCEGWIKAQPMDPAAHYLHAMVLIEQQQPAAAREELVRAACLEPDFAMAHVALGRLALAAGQTAHARLHFTNARALLARAPAGAAIAEADGLSAGQLLEVLATLAPAETLQ